MAVTIPADERLDETLRLAKPLGRDIATAVRKYAEAAEPNVVLVAVCCALLELVRSYAEPRAVPFTLLGCWRLLTIIADREKAAGRDA